MKKFAAFDIDGTLLRWQLYHAMASQLAKRGLLGKNGEQELKNLRKKWKHRETDTSFKDYERGLVKLFDANISNVEESVFDEVVQQVIAEYRQQTYIYTRSLLTKLKNDDYFLIAISGSHRELVEHIADYYKFDTFLGSNYERMDGKFTGEKFIVSKDKRAALSNVIEEHNLTLKNSIAVGDTYSDIPMLEMVETPIAFNPEKELYTKARQEGWKIVIERKNVIYKLNNHDGTYILE